MGQRKDFILFNAEKNCWPDSDLRTVYPTTRTAWRYLNAGVFMGKAGAIRTILEAHMHQINEDTDDQRMWTRLYLDDVAAGKDVIHIDSECSVFQSVLDVELPGDLSISDSGWQNTVTKSYPSIFHSNGDHSKVFRFIYPGLQVFAYMTGDELADRFMGKRISRLSE